MVPVATGLKGTHSLMNGPPSLCHLYWEAGGSQLLLLICFVVGVCFFYVRVSKDVFLFEIRRCKTKWEQGNRIFNSLSCTDN